MRQLEEIANGLADEWLAMMSAIDWSDHAKSIARRSPFPCGEATSIETAAGLLDVSDSYVWETVDGGDIRLTIDVYAEASDEPIAQRSAIIRRTT